MEEYRMGLRCKDEAMFSFVVGQQSGSPLSSGATVAQQLVPVL